MLIDGAAILSEKLRYLSPYASRFASHPILIVIPQNTSEVPAATFISARQKHSVFLQLGFRALMTTADKAAKCVSKEERPIPYIVQHPLTALDLPRHIRDRGIDLDRHSPIAEFEGSSAVAEAIARIVMQFRSDNEVIAIVGSNGRVGSAVRSILSKRTVDVMPIEQSDDLGQMARASVVITAMGRPQLIVETMLLGARLIIDAGFYWDRQLKTAFGDVHRSCYNTQALITPVPGGVGPLQVLTLVERAIHATTGMMYSRWVIPEERGA